MKLAQGNDLDIDGWQLFVIVVCEVELVEHFLSFEQTYYFFEGDALWINLADRNEHFQFYKPFKVDIFPG